MIHHGDFRFRRTLRVRSILARGKVAVRGAEIVRWKNGPAAHLSGGGDQDLYDPATGRSTEGLRYTLGVARRFPHAEQSDAIGAPQSGPRRTPGVLRAFRVGPQDRGNPGMIRFLRDDVDKALEQEWPTPSARPYAAEIGNHFYLHYGAACCGRCRQRVEEPRPHRRRSVCLDAPETGGFL